MNKVRLVKKVLADAKKNPAKLARREKRRQARLERQQARAAEAAKYRDMRQPGVERPQNPGDICYKCGDTVVYKETKRKPKPHQTYGYKGYLICPTCKTLYHCDQYKYEIPGRVQPKRSTINEDFKRAIDNDDDGEPPF